MLSLRARNAVVSAGLLTLMACGGGGGEESPLVGSETSFPSSSRVNSVVEEPAEPDQATQAFDDATLRAAMVEAGVNALPEPPAQNPDKVALGEALMFDKVLSGNKDISCATCHHPALASGDALSVSIGTGGLGSGEDRILGTGRDFIPRNAPPLFNLSTVDTLFWDGRVHQEGDIIMAPASLPDGLDSALAAQAMFPVTNRGEMRGEVGDTAVTGEANELADLADGDLPGQWEAIMARLRAIPGYQNLFAAAYPGVAPDELGFQHAANAIAAFEIDRFAVLNSPFDRYVGGEDAALTDAQKRGAALFYGDARCFRCHAGPLLSDFQFHNIAAPQIGPGITGGLDLGRFAETGDNDDRFRFRTPILRNVALTGPWMHSGPYTSLEAVVRHYTDPAGALQNYDPAQLRGDLQSLVFTQQQLDAGILDNLSPGFNTPIVLDDDEVDDLVAFLHALTDPSVEQRANEVPANVPSGLPVAD